MAYLQRTIDHIELRPVKVPHEEDLEHFEIIVQSKSFLHNQVAKSILDNVYVKLSWILLLQIRRIVGAALTASYVDNSNFNLAGIQKLLDNGKPGLWHPYVKVAPADGLHLTDIQFRPESLLTATEVYDQISNDLTPPDPAFITKDIHWYQCHFRLRSESETIVCCCFFQGSGQRLEPERKSFGLGHCPEQRST